MSYYEDCLEQFNKLPDKIKNKIGSLEAVKEISRLESEYEAELGFLVVLIAIGELKIDAAPNYLEKKSGLDFEEGLMIKKVLVEKIFNFILDEKQKAPLNLEESLKNIFGKKLLDFLKNSKNNKEINEQTLLILSASDSLAQDDLVKIFLANQEKLTDKDFVLDGKKQTPTISNWLKDFIKKNGSGMVDNLALSQYLAGSENAKKLDSQEKKLLHKLLILYRNLKFFPESMSNIPVEEWEIIPVDDEEKVLKRSQKIEKDERLVELESLLEQYEEGSLERKAIEEEIVRTTD